MPENTDFATAARAFLAPKDVLTGAKDMAPFLQDWRHMFTGRAFGSLFAALHRRSV